MSGAAGEPVAGRGGAIRRTLAGVRGDVLIVFAKAPRPGQVKTRLARTLGDVPAAELYRRLAEATLCRTAPVAAEYRRVVAFAPADARDEMAAWLPGETLAPQHGEGLGERMAAAFGDAFDAGARRVVLVGSDVPGLQRGHVVQAFAALDGHELALGPARDGGYYLIGLRAPQPGLFADVPWSTPAVLGLTLERAARLSLRVRLLATLRDVDTPEDAGDLEEELRHGRH